MYNKFYSGVLGSIQKKTFFPNQIPDLRFWMDADLSNFTFSSGTKISGMEDLSENGLDFVQANVPNQPNFVSSGLNGKPSVLFDVANIEHMTFAGRVIPIDHYTFTTFALVETFNQDIGQAYFLCIATTGSTYQAHGALAVGGDRERVYALDQFSPSGTPLKTPINTVTTNVPALYEVHSSGGATPTGQEIYIDGTLEGSTTGETFSGTTANQTVFGAQRTSGRAWDGYVRKLVVYLRDLSESESVLVREYMLR